MDNWMLVLGFIGMLILTGCVSNKCDKMWDDISEKVENANYCDNDVDCVMVYDGCCGGFVNVKEKVGVEEFVLEQMTKNEMCKRACSCFVGEEEEIKCMNNRCVDSRYYKLLNET